MPPFRKRLSRKLQNRKYYYLRTLSSVKQISRSIPLTVNSYSHETNNPKDEDVNVDVDWEETCNSFVPLNAGDRINGRYIILKVLGHGTFGYVYEVQDKETGLAYALKVIRSEPVYKSSAWFEIRSLQFIAAQQMDAASKLCVQMHNWFVCRDHTCILFDNLGESVFDVLKMNKYQPYPVAQIKDIAYQMCMSVNFLHRNKLTHTDLKPENILFLNSDAEVVSNVQGEEEEEYRLVKNPRVCLIDFGSATFEEDYHSSTVSTRHYRAPEVILGLGWSHPCDVWSLGSVLYELHVGKTLFQTHDDYEHLAMIEKVRGSVPAWMMHRSTKNFYTKGKLNWDPPEVSKGNLDKCPQLLSAESEDPETRKLYQLIICMLTVDPYERITMEKALEHPFFDNLSPTLKESLSMMKVGEKATPSTDKMKKSDRGSGRKSKKRVSANKNKNSKVNLTRSKTKSLKQCVENTQSKRKRATPKI